VWQADKNRSGFYMHVGSTQVQAAVCIQGAWHTDSLVTVPITSARQPGDQASWDSLAKALELLNQAMKPKLSKWVGQRLKMHVVLAHEWIDQASLPWTNGLANGMSAAAIRTGISEQMGSTEAQDEVRAEASGWQKPRWALVYKKRLMELLESCAQTLNLVAETLLPEAAVVGTAVTVNTRAQFVCAYVADQTLRMLEIQKGKVYAVLQRPMVGEQDSKAVAQVWQGVSLRSPHWQEQEFILLTDAKTSTQGVQATFRTQPWPQASQASIPCMLRALSQMAGSRHDLNAFDTRNRGARLLAILPLLLMGLLIIGLGGKWLQDAQRLKQVRLSNASVLQGVSAKQPSNSLNKAQLEQMAASNAAIRQLNLPVEQLLKALQAPKDIRVALLGVDLNDAGSESSLPKLKVNAEALTGEDAARYVAFLADRKPFVSAYMVRHEIQQNMPEKAWRFTMELTWQP
jgi:hypothetical protein